MHTVSGEGVRARGRQDAHGMGATRDVFRERAPRQVCPPYLSGMSPFPARGTLTSPSLEIAHVVLLGGKRAV